MITDNNRYLLTKEDIEFIKALRNNSINQIQQPNTYQSTDTINLYTNFNNWTERYPKGFGKWQGDNLIFKEKQKTNNTYSLKMQILDSSECGVIINEIQSDMKDNEYIYVECNFMIDSQYKSIDGAGIIIEWVYTNGYSRTVIDFGKENISYGKMNTIKKVIKRDKSIDGTFISYRCYLVGNSKRINPICSPKTIYFDTIVIKIASEQDVIFYNVFNKKDGKIGNSNLLKDLSVSNFTSSSGADKDYTSITDGNKVIGSDYYSFGSGNGSDAGPESEYLQVDLGDVYSINHSVLYFYSGDDRTYYYKIKYSTDGLSWKYIVGDDSNDGWSLSGIVDESATCNPTVDLLLFSINARYLRLYCNGNSVNSGNNIYEWELFSKMQGIVSGDNILENSISGYHIINNSITGAQILDGSIEIEQLADNSVDSTKIRNASITNAHIINSVIDNAKLKDACIGSSKIMDAAITSAKIGEAQILAAHIGKAQIDSTKIKDASITNAKIRDASITNAKIGDATITSAKILNLDADKIIARTITADKIKANTLTVNELATDVGSSLIISNATSVKFAFGSSSIGDNLLKNSLFLNKGTTNWWFWGDNTGQYLNDWNAYGEGQMLFGCSSSTNAGGMWQSNIPIRHNTAYTLNVAVSKEANVKGGSFVIEYQNSSDTVISSQTITLNFDNLRHSYTVTSPNDSNIAKAKMGFKHEGSNDGASSYLIFVTKPCFVQGSSCGGWSSNPNEINAGYTTINADGVTVTNGAITIKNNDNRTVFTVEDSGYMYNEWGIAMRATEDLHAGTGGIVGSVNEACIYRNFGLYHESTVGRPLYLMTNTNVQLKDLNADVYRNLSCAGVNADGDIWSSGYVSGANIINRSLREIKTNITKYDDMQAYDGLKGIIVYNFNMEMPPDIDGTEISMPSLNLGVIVDEAPIEITQLGGGEGADRKGINLYSYASYLASALKTAIAKIEILENEVNILKEGV